MGIVATFLAFYIQFHAGHATSALCYFETTHMIKINCNPPNKRRGCLENYTTSGRCMTDVTNLNKTHVSEEKAKLLYHYADLYTHLVREKG